MDVQQQQQQQGGGHGHHHGGHHHHHHHHHHHNQQQQQQSLKRQIRGGTESDDILEVMPIGAGAEVGRSCVLLKYKGKTIMFDCGVHPAFSGMSSLPFFDEISDASKIDLLLVSQ
ncbi:beta-lactamase domain-containing protein [Heterostelium album PN500]|uniref:Beta-lactamase domain-containing protein n=1 Tax=Heterostelium pallidum (strain ATCC 26659 / Pp 5 / PN500) TaxID=670386 RepID=D3BEC1_HETP5|nr:beta-lactamase domain-containing protein [Heterostelium album PN500]EFA80252.1 beta-lactamase domain-containing protein [Heterostelium album PN500]|eukprot:XP_020432372.1 beta-lactamase domain-containing protein [Heterostelium album PN500]